MIPFLKKNKDGKKPPKSTVPRTAQESIPFQRMFEDGTCRVRPGYYTRTIQYQDINYQLQISRFALKDLPEPGVPRIRPLGFFNFLRSTMIRLLDRAFKP